MTRAGSEVAGTAGRERIPLIERYREWLPVDAATPVVTLLEGSTPLVAAPRLSERIGIETHLKIEGMNPTGSFKDRGMTVAVSQAKANGAEAIICASTGNTAASTAAYAARAGVRGAVIVPGGKDRSGQARPGPDARCARDRAAGQLRPGARARQEDRRATRGRARQLDQPVPDRRPEDGGIRGLRRARPVRPTRWRSLSGTPATSRPGGRGSRSTAAGSRASSAFRPKAQRRSCWASRSSGPRRSRRRSGSETRPAGRRRSSPWRNRAAGSHR